MTAHVENLVRCSACCAFYCAICHDKCPTCGSLHIVPDCHFHPKRLGTVGDDPYRIPYWVGWDSPRLTVA